MQALRIARPTDDLDRIATFYRRGLELTELARFEDHAGFDGVVLGRHDLRWHPELVHRAGHTAGPAPDPEHLLAVFHDSTQDHDDAVVRVRAAGGRPTVHPNPYWNLHATVFLDPDDYPLVLVASPWTSTGRDGDSTHL